MTIVTAEKTAEYQIQVYLPGDVQIYVELDDPETTREVVRMFQSSYPFADIEIQRYDDALDTYIDTDPETGLGDW